MAREHVLAEAFVGLADILAEDYDLVDLLHRLTSDCVRLLPIDEAALALADQPGHLSITAASGARSRELELCQLDWDEGPGPDCFRSRAPVDFPDLAAEARRWPRFTALARQHGFRAGHALPMRLRTETIGALILFYGAAGALPEGELTIAQALADAATIGVLADRALRERELLAEQLRSALDSRVIIEQAKGVLAERGGISTEAAFVALRRYARGTNQRLSSLARGVVDGTVGTEDILR
jgi:hypothetical protein